MSPVPVTPSHQYALDQVGELVRTKLIGKSENIHKLNTNLL